MGDKSLPIDGEVKTTLISNGYKMEDAVFLVVPESPLSILGRETAEILDLLRVGPVKEETDDAQRGGEPTSVPKSADAANPS